MIVYHGSYLEIKKPDLRHSRSNVDFGRGFLYDASLCSGSKVVWQI